MESKKLILVASPAGCGKTYLAKKLARALGNVVYIDKDVLNPFGKQMCRLSGVDYNPDCEFFVREVRPVEYTVTMDMAFEALEFSDTVIVNAPFGKELWDSAYMTELKAKAETFDAHLYVAFIESSSEICKKRVTERNNIRDKWKLENWDEYIKNINFRSPTHLADILDLYLYHNATDEIAAESFAGLLEFLGK
ncbi:MAG: ATP-binding protein [Ruminococcaceae bacterium]|nr:ATP-binding protein [Oscillospiraceae bacterium]